MIGLGRRWTEEVFDETDLDALAVMGHQAGLALDVARQIRELRLISLQVEQAQLNERERIAGDLHDTTQAQLTQLPFALERVRGQLYADPAQAEQLLDDCIQDIGLAARELRSILRALIPERLWGRSLSAALQDYASTAQELRGDVQIDLEADPELEALLPPDRKLALLRICQQALDNALAHAQARSIRITLQAGRDRDAIEFSIVDDGRGFMRRPAGEFIQRGHHGLHVMESRALQCGGRLEIVSTPGQGTVVKGYLPAERSDRIIQNE
jgi:signal transduction histidine kinase